jgi:hypothetical protein
LVEALALAAVFPLDEAFARGEGLALAADFTFAGDLVLAAEVDLR